jgi:hypothetical protein
MHLGIVSATVLVSNLPFGYWRAHAGKFSFQWFLAVHLPVLLAVSLRVLGGLGWELVTFPALIGAYCLGQFLGGTIHSQRERRGEKPLTACLVCDLWKKLYPNGTRTL